ncbi:hypothetical protein BSNK01_31240 [Bacillaceae bacterium]
MRKIPKEKRRKQERENAQNEPTIAPGMEMDALDAPAPPEEVAKGDFTRVTRLYIDRIDD